jgi:hypothetical protein
MEILSGEIAGRLKSFTPSRPQGYPQVIEVFPVAMLSKSRDWAKNWDLLNTFLNRLPQCLRVVRLRKPLGAGGTLPSF